DARGSKKAIRDLDGLRSLVALLSNESGILQESVACVLANLIHRSEESIYTLANMNAQVPLAAALACNMANVQREASRALVNLFAKDGVPSVHFATEGNEGQSFASGVYTLQDFYNNWEQADEVTFEITFDERTQEVYGVGQDGIDTFIITGKANTYTGQICFERRYSGGSGNNYIGAWRHTDQSRGANDQSNSDNFNEEVKQHAWKETGKYPRGATMHGLEDSHSEDMARLLEATGKDTADMTALEAVAEYMATIYEDTRELNYQRGIPLETIYGTVGSHGKAHYSLVVNCTDLQPDEQNGLGMHAKEPQVTVGPFREDPKAAVDYLGQLTAAVRHFHAMPENAPVLHPGQQTRLRWYADKVADVHLTFAKNEYALTVLATSLVHIPLHCVPLGADNFKVTDRCIPRARVYNPRQTRTGNDERQLHIISESLRGQTTRDLEKQLREMGCVESAIKGARGQPAYMEGTTNSIRLVAVTQEAADSIEAKAGLGADSDHLKELQPTTVRPGTDPAKLDTYLRTRITRKGTLFTGLASEAAYEWLGKQERRMVRFKIPNKNRVYLLQHSDFSRTGDKFAGKRREAAPAAWGTDQTEAVVVQALESELSSQWANVVKGNAAGDREILRLRNAVAKLEETCKNGFKDTVTATHEVSAKVDEVNASVIDLTDQTKTFNAKHIEIAGEIVLGQHTVSCADDSAMSYMPVVSYAPYSISARDPC
ncbi:hypothetical protein CYMTET_42793, partial [Cymbomonas tetramitiformis]